jgi:membrane protease YdiL (CAAX protease family)
VIHFRYLKKKFLLLETFILGLIMGLVYKYTAQLYAVVLCHFCVNIGTAFLLKKKIITLE